MPNPYRDFFGDPIDGDDMNSRILRATVDRASEAKWHGLLSWGTRVKFVSGDGRTYIGKIIGWTQDYQGYHIGYKGLVYGAKKSAVRKIRPKRRARR